MYQLIYISIYPCLYICIFDMLFWNKQRKSRPLWKVKITCLSHAWPPSDTHSWTNVNIHHGWWVSLPPGVTYKAESWMTIPTACEESRWSRAEWPQPLRKAIDLSLFWWLECGRPHLAQVICTSMAKSLIIKWSTQRTLWLWLQLN